VQPERLAEWFDAYQARLYRLACRLSGDPEEARDLVQEAFLRLARSRTSLPQDGGHAEAWLVKTLVNLCRDRGRKLRVRRKHRENTSASAPPPAAPESAAMARMAVQQALNQLPLRRRAVVALRELEGLGTDEIARVLGLARATVRWHLHAGRRDLKKILFGE
jgi:RNA polymerase sigma-70 factor (ECF subfamily)